MIVERVEHPGWLSNAYLIADGPGGHGVLVDSNGLTAGLEQRAARDEITITHVLCTHGHPDHVVDIAEVAKRVGAPLYAHPQTAVAADERLAAASTVSPGSSLPAGNSTTGPPAPGRCWRTSTSWSSSVTTSTTDGGCSTITALAGSSPLATRISSRPSRPAGDRRARDPPARRRAGRPRRARGRRYRCRLQCSLPTSIRFSGRLANGSSDPAN